MGIRLPFQWFPFNQQLSDMENMTVSLPAFQIFMVVVAAMLALFNGLILAYLKSNHAERKEDRERLIRIETRLEGLDSMRGDIQSTRHKQQHLDTEFAKLAEKVDGVIRRCGYLHKDHEYQP